MVRVHYVQHRRDGGEQIQDRDLLDRGDGVTVLLFNKRRRTLLLVRQPRIAATLRGYDAETIEACNGQVGNEDPLQCAFREIEEETGHRPKRLDLMASVFAAPGASLELIHIYLGEYDDDTQVSKAGGLIHEGEDIQVVEVGIEQAKSMISTGEVRDGRSILAIQFAISSGRLGE